MHREYACEYSMACGYMLPVTLCCLVLRCYALLSQPACTSVVVPLTWWLGECQCVLCVCVCVVCLCVCCFVLFLYVDNQLCLVINLVKPTLYRDRFLGETTGACLSRMIVTASRYTARHARV